MNPIITCATCGRSGDEPCVSSTSGQPLPRRAWHANRVRAELLEEGRRLASEREDLIAQGVSPSELAVPLAPLPASTTETERQIDMLAQLLSGAAQLDVRKERLAATAIALKDFDRNGLVVLVATLARLVFAR